MRHIRFGSIFATAALVFAAGLLSTQPAPRHRSGVVRPMTKIRGPFSPISPAADPKLTLLTCQVIGLSPDFTCYDPFQIRRAYNIDTLINAGLDGRTKRIVIIDAFQAPNISLDLARFNSVYGLPTAALSIIAPDGLTPFDPSNAEMVGWALEITLDVEWAHAIAPGASIVLVLAKSSNDADILSATKYAVDHDLGDVISQSFGENEACMDANLVTLQHQIFAAATAKGITLFASSGDDGAAQPNCDSTALVRAASTPATDPLVTAVGGTDLHAARYCLTVLGCNPAINPAPGTRLGEVTWNESDIGGGATGGGFSILYDIPQFQQGTINPIKQRGVPDVAYNAAVNDGVIAVAQVPGFAGGVPVFVVFGGTSAGSPQWAGIAAIANQMSGQRLGFINKALYKLGQSGAGNRASYFDITVGNNSIPGITGFNAGSGWDAATGFGSPVTDHIVGAMIKAISPQDGANAIRESGPHPGQGSGAKRMKPHAN